MKENLIKYLNSKRIPEDLDLKNKIQELKNYFNNFFRKFSPKKLYELAELSDKDLILAFLIIHNPFKINEILELIKRYPDLIPNNNYSLLPTYFNDEQLKNEIGKYLKGDLSNLFAEFRVPEPTRNVLTSFIKENHEGSEELEPILKNISTEDNNLCACLIVSKSEFNALLKIAEIYAMSLSANYDVRKALKREFLPSQTTTKNLMKAAQIYSEHINILYSKIIKDYETSEKERRQHNKNIKELIKLLDTKEEIKNIDDILRLCPDTKTTNSVVDYIIYHNRELYQELIVTYEKSKVNSDENLTVLFNKYGFTYEMLNKSEKDKLKEMLYEDIENLLKRLNNLYLYNINITGLNVSNLSVIEELLSKNLITKNWLKENINLLYENECLELVNSNISLLANKNINIMLYTNSLDILKSVHLKQNLELLDFYNLTINKSTTDINFLSNSDLNTKIEFLISIGLFQELENLDILNYSLLEYHKLKIANILNIPITMIDIDKEDLINDYANIIIPSSINKILNNETNSISELPISLEKYLIDNYALNINGVLVSVEKIKRNIAKLESTNNESCFYAIIHNGYYTYEEIEKIAYSLELERDFYNLCTKKLSL